MARDRDAALRALRDLHARRILAVALRIVRSRPDAEEVVQDTLLTLWQRAASYDPARGDVRAWLIEIARNRAIDRLRSRSATGRALAVLTREHAAQLGWAPAPDQRLLQRELRQSVGRALRALPAHQRALIELAYFEGLSQREIAARTGHPLGTIKGRTRAALAQLATQLGRDGDPHPAAYAVRSSQQRRTS